MLLYPPSKRQVAGLSPAGVANKINEFSEKLAKEIQLLLLPDGGEAEASEAEQHQSPSRRFRDRVERVEAGDSLGRG